MGQANVRRWVNRIMPLLEANGDPLGVDDFATHRTAFQLAVGVAHRVRGRRLGWRALGLLGEFGAWLV